MSGTRESNHRDVVSPQLKVSRVPAISSERWILGALLLVILMTMISPFLSATVYRALGIGTLPEATLAVKDLLLLGFLSVVAISVLRRRKIEVPRDVLAPVVLMLVWVAAIIVLSAISPASFGAVLVNMRRLIVLPLVLLACALLTPSLRTLEGFSRVTCWLVGVVVLFGLVLYVMPDWWWDRVLLLPSYWANVAVDPFAESSVSTSGRFYSWDLALLGGSKIRRLVSTFLEPTGLAAVIATGLVFTLYAPAFAWRRVLLLVLFVGGVLTFSKAFLLSAIVAAGTLFFRRLYPSWLILGTAAFYGLSVGSTVAGLTIGMFAHITGLHSGVLVIADAPLGLGVGAAGNYAFDDVEAMSLGAESGLGNVLAQVGIAGILMPLMIYVTLANLARKYHTNGSFVFRAAFTALLNWYLVFLFSASSLGVGGNLLTFILCGLALSARTGVHQAAPSAAVVQKLA